MSIYPTIFVTLTGVILAWFCVDWLLSRRASKKRWRFFAARGHLSSEQWFSIYWKKHDVSLDATVLVCEALATALECHFTALRPEDSFSEELTIRRWAITGIDNDSALEKFENELLPTLLSNDLQVILNSEVDRIERLVDLVKWYDLNRDRKA